MNDVFKSHNDITEEDFTKLWEKGLFVFDTNVLLDLYRLPESAKKDLLNILNVVIFIFSTYRRGNDKN